MLINSFNNPLFSILSASVSQIYGLGRGLGSTSYSSRSDAIPVPMPAVQGVVLEAFSRKLRKLFPLLKQTCCLFQLWARGSRLCPPLLKG